MDQIESQIAKIQLFSPRTANNYVFVMAEKAAGSDAELYMVAELPLLNPAAREACEQICLAVAGGLRRVYKRPLDENSFENAVAQINEELGKQAGMGQTYWINKFNCILGVKNNKEFTIATCGKTSAFLLRDGDFADISTSSVESHPLKTFDTFATGKIRLGDILILSNTQLLNFVSMDRLKQILKQPNFLAAAQTIIELLKESGGPQVGFGTIFNLQVPEGQAGSDEVDLENYVIEDSGQESLIKKAGGFLKNLAGMEALRGRQSKADLPQPVSLKQAEGAPLSKKEKLPDQQISRINLGEQKLSATERLADIKIRFQKLLHGTKGSLGDFSDKLKNTGRNLSPKQIKQFSPAKKFLFVAIVVLVFAAALNIGVASYNKNVKQKKLAVAAKLQQASKELNLAQSSFLYKEDQQAQQYYIQAQNDLPKASEIFKDQQNDYQKILNQLDDFKKQISRTTDANPKKLGDLADGKSLIRLPDYLAVQAGKNLISYEKASQKIEDGKLKASVQIQSAQNFKTGQAVIFDGQSLRIWGYTTDAEGSSFISSVPPADRFVGMAYYATNNRVYLIDKQKNQIISFLINKDKLQNPVVSVTDSFADAQDIAIDGNIYILHQNSISKYAAGKRVDFPMPFLFSSFSGTGRLYTEINWQYLYLLDISQKRILVMDKKGNLIKTFVSDKFTNLKDFAVDEQQRIIYILNGTELFRVDF